MLADLLTHWFKLSLLPYIFEPHPPKDGATPGGWVVFSTSVTNQEKPLADMAISNLIKIIFQSR